MTDTIPNRLNPYVGPRAFQRGETLYGRDREVMELVDLLIAERIILLHSPSGAGKTSLIQAALVPELEREGFWVLPPMRVSMDPPSAADQPSESVPNRYVLSLLLSLEEVLPEDQQMPLAELMGLSLSEYLTRRRKEAESAEGVVLIFDQFEEILTVDPADRAAKVQFFGQVGAALRDRRRWALFSMRDEFLASLEPYLRPVPTRLNNTYRLELLGHHAALLAIQQPAREAGVEFTDGAATKLVDDLRQMRIQLPDGTTEEQPGLYVEPVQLQVVCRRVWDRLAADATRIVEADVESVGDVDSALAGYYAERVVSIAAETGISERTIRNWFDHHLITEQGIRGQVLKGLEQSEGLDNDAIWPLVDAHLVRAEKRRGATWFELAHDRLIEPVQRENAAWRMVNLSPLERQAALWQEQNRQDGLLLRGQALAEAEAWAAAHEEELTEVEHEFLWACQEARSLAERRRARRVRWVAAGTTVFSIIAVILAITAFVARQDAVVAEQTAVAGQTEAVAGQETAIAAQSTAVVDRLAAIAGQTEAVAGQQTAIAAQSEAIAAKETAETDRMIAENAVQSLESNLQALRTAQAPTSMPAATPTPLPPTPSPTILIPATGGGPDAPETAAPVETATAAAEATRAAEQTQQARAQATQTARAVTPTPAALADNLRDFGSIQGGKGWKYLVEDGRNSGRWQDMRFGQYAGKQCWLTVTSESYVRICEDGEVHPGVTTRVAYEWRSTINRNVQIRLHARKIDTGCGDGVNVRVFKVGPGSANLDELVIRPNDDTGVTKEYQTGMTLESLLYVVVDINGDAACDASQLEIGIY
jgi:hypothetical protein